MKTRSFLLQMAVLIALSSFSCEKEEEVNLVIAKTTFSKENVIAYFPFNGNASNVSDRRSNGSVFGAVPTTGRNDESNGAYLFDGIDDYIHLPVETSLNTDSSFSIETWIYKDCHTADAKYNDDGIFGQSDGHLGSDFPLVRLEVHPDKTIRGVIRGSANPVLEVRPDDTIENHTWHHIVLARNPEENSLSLYLDGKLISKSKTSLVGNTSTNDFVSVGAVFDDLQQLYHFYCGKIDMIRFWNISLTETDATELKNDNYVIK
ncbi:MAG: LamG-like jellyroll fold domain-containing protein [Bacteroidota bacterium]